MCGIIGIASKKGFFREPIGKVLKGCLERLEYRGYDSVGFSVISKGKILVKKAEGKLADVTEVLNFDQADGEIAMGHTRWATHGRPNDINAHPHTDCNGAIAVIHNGIIQNYLELKKMLIERGHVFKSETDTEVIPHLLEEYVNAGLTPLKALRKVFSILRGSFAFSAVFLRESDKVFFARLTSPLVIGLGDGVNFIASDIPAFLIYTRKVIVVRDYEFGYITSDNVYLEHLYEGPIDISKRIRIISWSPSMAMKGGYPHFMLKEIHEQPISLKMTFEGLGEEIEESAKMITSAEKIFITACGTSFHAGLIGDFIFSDLANIPSHTFVASEYLKYEKIAGQNDVVIVISQSGETIDSLMALRKLKARGARVISISNVIDSAIPRESDITIYTRAGPEIGVAATKTFTTQTLVLLAIGYTSALMVGNINRGEYREFINSLGSTPKITERVIRSYEGRLKELGENISKYNNAYYLSRGLGIPISMEGALKLKEIAYIHAEAYPAGESKHGPIALIEQGFPVIFSVFNDENYENLIGNVEEMNARGAYTIGLVPEGDKIFKNILDLHLEMPVLEPYYTNAIHYIIPLQLLAYYAATARGYDPDKPRNLAKTVTVE